MCTTAQERSAHAPGIQGLQQRSGLPTQHLMHKQMSAITETAQQTAAGLNTASAIAAGIQLMMQMQDRPETVQMSHAINGVTVIGITAAEIVSPTNLFKEIEALLDSMTETRHTEMAGIMTDIIAAAGKNTRMAAEAQMHREAAGTGKPLQIHQLLMLLQLPSCVNEELHMVQHLSGVRIIESLSSLELKGCTIAVVSRATCSRCGDKQQVNRKRSIKKAHNLNSKIEANDST